ncbi:MAG: 2-oxo acid dehydrogenase subunit E2 [Legionellaceae bacterium]|nr:2-oxo acid dehydrogenase subunit E2 [Legionellaceae bacterium]
MDTLNALLRPGWGSEKWIAEGWQKITDDERSLIQTRVDALFSQGLPFELKQDKLLYIYAFSLLAQLEVLAIQVPLKFESKLSNPDFKRQLRTQLLDEIFHGIVFTRIVYLLCEPHASPPAYNDNIEHLCNFIRNEDCPKVALMLLNLIGEGWIEEIFYSMEKQGIAPAVFATILADEHRHVGEADLYRAIGMPDMPVVQRKLAYLEEQLLTNIFFQYKYSASLSLLLGAQGSIDFLQALDKKHQQQLKKINLSPSEHWKGFMKMGRELFPAIAHYSESNHAIPMTPIRKFFMTQWSNPSDPTMVGEFNMDVSCLDFFNKAFPSETLTSLMLQAISVALSSHPGFRVYLSHNRLYRAEEAYVGVVVMLPDCGDHIGTIVFENCHKMPVQELALKIRRALQMMVFCYKKRAHLEQAHPHLAGLMDEALVDIAHSGYPYPMPGNPMVTLSNIGFCGYTRTKSPLRCNEAMKFTLLEVERKMVWNKGRQQFEAQDILPVSISADHRIFDGNLPVPKLMQNCFQQMFDAMLQGTTKPTARQEPKQDAQWMQMVDQLLDEHLETGYKALTVLQTLWLDFIELEHLISSKWGKRAVVAN